MLWDGRIDQTLGKAPRFDTFAEGLRATRGLAEEFGDIDTADLLTAMLQQHEKHGWFLRATLGV